MSTSIEGQCAYHYALVPSGVIITVRNSSCGKVMFSQVSVHWRRCTPPWTDTPPPRADTPSPARHPPQQTATAADGYASYWNAFFFLNGPYIITFVEFAEFS